MSLRPETLKRYVALARPILIRMAREGELITYKELSQRMGGPGRGYIGKVLKEICQGEHRHARPLLGTLVVHKYDQFPGNGAWKSSVVPESIKNSSREDKKNFWQNERKKVYEHWAKTPIEG